MVTEKDELLTPAEAGRLLKVAPGTLSIWRCTKRFALNWVKIGGRVRYRRSALEKFIEHNTMDKFPEKSRTQRAKASGVKDLSLAS